MSLVETPNVDMSFVSADWLFTRKLIDPKRVYRMSKKVIGTEEQEVLDTLMSLAKRFEQATESIVDEVIDHYGKSRGFGERFNKNRTAGDYYRKHGFPIWVIQQILDDELCKPEWTFDRLNIKPSKR